MRLERQSWYHFGDEEQERISASSAFSAWGPPCTAGVYAALRRFGCHVNVTQCRFLVVRRATK